MMPEEKPTKPGHRLPPMPSFSDEEKTTPHRRATVPAGPTPPHRNRPEFDFSRDPRHDPD